jgi:hypothetical protein
VKWQIKGGCCHCLYLNLCVGAHAHSALFLERWMLVFMCDKGEDGGDTGNAVLQMWKPPVQLHTDCSHFQNCFLGKLMEVNINSFWITWKWYITASFHLFDFTHYLGFVYKTQDFRNLICFFHDRLESKTEMFRAGKVKGKIVPVFN